MASLFFRILDRLTFGQGDLGVPELTGAGDGKQNDGLKCIDTDEQPVLTAHKHQRAEAPGEQLDQRAQRRSDRHIVECLGAVLGGDDG